jgi:hypothetical protein
MQSRCSYGSKTDLYSKNGWPESAFTVPAEESLPPSTKAETQQVEFTICFGEWLLQGRGGSTYRLTAIDRLQEGSKNDTSPEYTSEAKD